MTPEEYVDQLGAFECFAENIPGHDFRPGFCRTCLINQFVAAILAERNRVFAEVEEWLYDFSELPIVQTVALNFSNATKNGRFDPDFNPRKEKP